MATEKNITMKQFNGTDYDTLYPKTLASQIPDVYSKSQTYPQSQLYTRSQLYTQSQIDSMINSINTALDRKARIQTGSYVGTGTYGESNPCSLTFDFAPKFIIFTNRKISRSGYASIFTYPNAGSHFIMINTQILTTTYIEGTGFGISGRDSNPYGAKSEDGKTIYWFSRESAESQFNAQNYTYYWVAFS